MTKYVLIMLLAVLLVPVAAFGQEFEHPPEEPPHPEMGPERQMELRRLELRLQQEEAELEIQRQLKELQLQERRLELENAEKTKQAKHTKCRWHHKKDDFHPILLLCIIVHILVAIWVYQDIRKRNAGSGIWIVIALIAGLLGTLVYAIVRIGDVKQEKS